LPRRNALQYISSRGSSPSSSGDAGTPLPITRDQKGLDNIKGFRVLNSIIPTWLQMSM
jgi:hypothetical protein